MLIFFEQYKQSHYVPYYCILLTTPLSIVYSCIYYGTLGQHTEAFLIHNFSNKKIRHHVSKRILYKWKLFRAGTHAVKGSL